MSETREETGAGIPERAALSGDESLVLAEFDAPPNDPVPLLRAWLDGAEAAAVREPWAASLATAGAVDGGTVLPSTRIILVKDLDAQGFLFGTYTSSRKGRDLAATPYAALGFYWRETMQQLRVEGPVERLSDAESAALFADRPRAAQATTAASRQGAPLDDEGGLAARAAALDEGSDAIRMPGDWAAYRLVPTSIEFWQGRTSRLHRRLAYRRISVAAPWTHARLQP
ncbi:pyridoxal 5'-phosphate synthase [Leifsonia poae]|uniref:Pyridoxine/pyridoxamine 5'-phosphate oxidase n=1 Tax=Leifsonia poae TaxID=110933 RepID=A0A9W6H9J8_9MICO|nr:pyridoxal 5'-phosphate synthase [Leifsonia poae]GLJ76414.1 pyridoxine/pyridoxamine 5'-phosphate oxidase [Leifsonia poae]